jgi:hydroxymethylbilane synthase
MAEAKLRIGSRGSDLALWQARYTAGRMGGDPELIIIKTEGDRIQHLSLDKVEGKGFFTKEIEAALLAREIDVAVHSYKDLPIEGPAGLAIVAVPERAPVRDVIIMRRDRVDAQRQWGLPQGARVGTSSLRRKAQLLAHRKDLQLVDLRGNVPTRLRKALAGELDAVVLAEAGVTRLGLPREVAEKDGVMTPLALAEVCPAPAQGALAIQTRADDVRARAAVSPLHDAATALAVQVERDLLARFGGGCHLPLGAYCDARAGQVHLRAIVAAPDGAECLVAEATAATPSAAVDAVHAALVKAGAQRYVG